MNCDRFDLDDYVDGSRTVAGPGELERHLAVCPACRATVDGLRDLARATAALPRDLPPTDDLLPGIRAAVQRRDDPGSQGSGLRWTVLAASVLLAALLAGVLWRGGAIRGPGAAARAEPAAPSAMFAEFRAAEAEYAAAVELLLGTLAERSAGLTPEAVAALDENLAVIDRAIREVRTVLEAQPPNPTHGHTLNALHRQRMELVWRISRLSS